MKKIELTNGLFTWQNEKNGFNIFELWWWAHPERDEKWEQRMRANMPAEDFEREYNLNFSQSTGKQVYPEFSDDNIMELQPFSDNKIILRGWDFGYHHPAVVFMQLQEPKIYVLQEMMGQNILLDLFAKNVLRYSSENYKDYFFLDFCDPAGRQMSDKNEKTSIEILRSLGVHPKNRKTSIIEGLDIIRRKIIERDEKGSPNFYIDPQCRVLIEGFRGGYHFPEKRNDLAAREVPKNDGYYEHLQDGLRYILVNNFRNRANTKREKVQIWRKKEVNSRFTG